MKTRKRGTGNLFVPQYRRSMARHQSLDRRSAAYSRYVTSSLRKSPTSQPANLQLTNRIDCIEWRRSFLCGRV